MWQASNLHSLWLVQKFLSIHFLVWSLWYKDHQSHSRTFFGTTCTCELLHSALLSWFIRGTITHSYHWPLNQKYVYAPRQSNGSKSWILIFWMKLHGSSATSTIDATPLTLFLQSGNQGCPQSWILAFWWLNGKWNQFIWTF